MTGGPECIHQYCNALNLMGFESYMVYSEGALGIPPDGQYVLYGQYYPLLQRADEVDDKEENVLIIPEMYSYTEFRKRYPTIRIVVDWLSVDGGLTNVNDNLKCKYHMFQSYYAKDFVVSNLSHDSKWFMVGDYMNDTFMYQQYNGIKKNIVAFNPRKDKKTMNICVSNQFDFVPIVNMAPFQIAHVLKTCKVYVDLGHHPGADRLPKEAAACGCVVITNKQGSANFFDDVPIEQKSEDLDEIAKMIKDAFENYEQNYVSQKEYRDRVKNMKALTHKQLFDMVDYLKN